MVFKDVCVLVLGTKVTSALEGLKAYAKTMELSVVSDSPIDKHQILF